MQTLASQLSCKLSLLDSHQFSCKLSFLISHQLSFSFDRGFIISSDYEEVGGPSNAHETSGYETPDQNKMYKKPKKSPENPGYAELDKNRLQGRNDGTYQKLVKRDSDYVIPAHERRESYEDIKMGRNLPDYEELDLSKREADDYQKLMKT
jgi:hypothetical protein